MISVTINGAITELEGPVSVTEYLEQKGLAGRRLAIAINGTVLRNDEVKDAMIEDGDRVEIVRPVGGG